MHARQKPQLVAITNESAGQLRAKQAVPISS